MQLTLATAQTPDLARLSLVTAVPTGTLDFSTVFSAELQANVPIETVTAVIPPPQVSKWEPFIAPETLVEPRNITCVPPLIDVADPVDIKVASKPVASVEELEKSSLELPVDDNDRTEPQAMTQLTHLVAPEPIILLQPTPVPPIADTESDPVGAPVQSMPDSNESHSPASTKRRQGAVPTLSTSQTAAPAIAMAQVDDPGRPVPLTNPDEPLRADYFGARQLELPPVAEPKLPSVVIRPEPAAPVEHLLTALSQGDPAERQWLETVIRDVSAATSKTGNFRFRVDPDGLGKIMIERTADRLEIGVAETRSLTLVEAARPQVLAGAAALGVPVSTSSVVLDQSGSRQRGEAPSRPQIEIEQQEDVARDNTSHAGRYA